MNSKCVWIRAFDGHFNIGCVNENGQRGNANFKKCSVYKETKWILNTASTAEKKLK